MKVAGVMLKAAHLTEFCAEFYSEVTHVSSAANKRLWVVVGGIVATFKHTSGSSVCTVEFALPAKEKIVKFPQINLNIPSGNTHVGRLSEK